MSKSNKGRREGLTVQAVNPEDGKPCEVFISQERILSLRKRGMGAIKEAGFLVEYCLKHPTAIFEGLRRDEDEDCRGVGWRCYCGTPNCAYASDGKETNPPRGKVFLVFVNDEGVAYNWRWDLADAENNRLPEHYDIRFKRRAL